MRNRATDVEDQSAQSTGPRQIAPIVAAAALVIVPLVVLVIVPLGFSFSSRTSDERDPKGAHVGSDLHSLAVIDDTIFVSGHQGVGRLKPGGAWESVESLAGADGMGWAATKATTFVGAHSGLFQSEDGSTFQRSTSGLGSVDVHALGGTGERLYVGTPGGLLTSKDGGSTFRQQPAEGAAFYGTIAVAETSPGTAYAVDTDMGLSRTSDGGRSWGPVRVPFDVMAVAVHPESVARIAVVGPGGAALSIDGGSTWTALKAPTGTAAVAFSASGQVLVATFASERARVFAQSIDGWTELGK